MLYNETKNRKATNNEIAKSILLDAISCKMDFLSESFYLEDIKLFEGTDGNGWGKATPQFEEIIRHFKKHYKSILDRLSNGDNIVSK